MLWVWQLACALLVFALLSHRFSPEKVRAQDGSSATEATTGSSSASLNKRDVGRRLEGHPQESPVEEHEIDRVRREMLYDRPPHFDIRSRPGFSSASPAAARAVLRERPRVKGRKSEPYCQPCDRVFIDQYSYNQHNIFKHSETLARSSRSTSSDQLSSTPGLCDICERTFDSAIALLQHKAACRIWSNGCSRCSIKSFRNAEEATAHYRRAHPAHPARYLSPLPHTVAPSRRSSSTYSSNQTLRETIVAAEPDPTLPELQRTYGCERCSERFPTTEERDEHLSSPFAHGDQSALAAAFPPLSASPASSTPVDASPVKEQSDDFPPLTPSEQLEKGVEVIKPESIPLPEDAQNSVETASSASSEQLSGEINDASSETDQAIALDQPLPSFQFSSDGSDLPSAPSSVSAELVTPDESDSEGNTLYRWGEIIEPPGPPGIEAFPELPSRLLPADDQLKPVESRWHTGERPSFAIPDLTPRPEKHTFWEADVDPRPWSEQVDDEYADEVPAWPVNMPIVSGSNSIPLGTRRSSPSVVLASPARSKTPGKGRSRRPPPASLTHYQVNNNDYNNHTNYNQVGDDSFGGTSGVKYPLPMRPRSPEGGKPIYGEIEEQIPNFAYAGPGDADTFNAFPEAPLSLVDPMGPKPAPVKAQPSVWSVPAQPRADLTSITLPKVWGQAAGMSIGKNDNNINNNSNIIPASPTGGKSSSSSGPVKGSRAGTVTPGQSGPKARWADRSKSFSQTVAIPLSATASPFELAGWTTSVPAIAPKRSRGGKAVAPENWAEREAREAKERREVAESMKSQVRAGEEDPYGGW